MKKRQQMKNKYWEKVGKAVASGRRAYWDECHRIYVVMDDEEVWNFEMLGYTDPIIFDDEGLDASVKRIKEWWDSSCGLRFIEAVSSVSPGVDANQGFQPLIPQFTPDFDLEED